MKKLLALMLTVLMILSSVSLVAAESILNPESLYVGVKTITLKYSENVNADNIGGITIADKDGVAVEFTPSFEGKILTLSFADRIDITKDYELVVNGKKYVFNYNVIWDADVKNSGLAKIKANKGNGLHIHTIADDNALITRGNHGYLVPNFDTTSYENLSIVFDAYYLGSNNTPRAFVGFNVNSNSQRWLESSTSANYFAWYTTTDGDDHKHRYNIPYTDSTGTANKVNSNSELPDAPYSNALANGSNTVTYTDTDATSGNTRGTAEITANTEPLLAYTVDKMGEIGTLSINNQIVDVWDTAEIYASNDAIKDETVPKTGYIYVASFGDGYNSAMYIKDWKLVTSNIDIYNDTLNITDNIYAGQDTITVKLSAEETITELRPEQAAKIKITRMDTGVNVPFANKVSGDILTIMPTESFVINNADAEAKVSYLLEIGDMKKVFTVNKLWEDKLDTATSTATDDTGLKNSSAAKAVADGKLIYDGVSSSISNGTAVYPDEATYVNKENVSFSAKVQFLNKFPSYNFMFNMSTEFTQPYNAGWNSFVGFGFHTYYGQSASQWYDKYTHTNKPVYNYYEKVSEETIINEKTFLPAYSNDASTAVLNSKPLIELSAAVEASASKNKWTDANYVVTDEMKDKNIFELTVDKMGSVATLVQEGKLFDSSITATRNLVTVYDTADVFETVTALNGKTAPLVGRFGIATYGGNTVMAFYDMVLTETEMRDYEVGSFNVTDIFADKDKMTVTFDSNIEKADLSKVVLTQADGSVVECSKVVTDNELVITPNGGFVLDRVYNITLSEDFGYDAVLISNEYAKDFRINKIKEITFDDGETYEENGIEIRTSGGTPAATIRNGKLYVQDAYYSTIYIRNAATDVENYRVNFTMQRYAGSWYNSTHIMFNAGKGSILNYGNGEPAFGWQMRGNNSTMYHDYRHAQHKTGSDTYRTIVENGFIPKASATDVTFTANAEKGDYDVVLPSTDATVYNIQLDKTGTKGALTVDGNLIDVYETKDVYKNWNAMQTDESKKLESEIVPSKGDILIAGYNTSGATVGTIAIGTITFTSFELIEDTMEIVKVTYFDANGNVLEDIKGATGVKGEVSVKSYFNGKKPIALVAIAYAGDEMIAADVLDINEVEGAATASATYSLSGLKGLTEIKVLAWESFATLYPYAAAFTK